MTVTAITGSISTNPATLQICPGNTTGTGHIIATSNVAYDVYYGSTLNTSQNANFNYDSGAVNWLQSGVVLYLKNHSTGATITTYTITSNTTGCPDFSITDNTNTSQTVPQGSSPTYAVTVNAINGFSGNVTLSNSSCPTNATCTFSPNPTTPGTVNLIISNTASTPGGTYNFTPSGNGSSGTHSGTNLSLTVTAITGSISTNPATLQICPGNTTGTGHIIATSNVAYDVYYGSTLNTSQNANFNYDSGAVNWLQSGVVLYLKNHSTGATITTYTITSNTTGCPDFSITDNTNTSQTVPQGSSPTYAVTVNAINGFSGNVTLSNSSCPTNATCTFSPNPTTPGTVNLIISNTASTPGGTYRLYP